MIFRLPRLLVRLNLLMVIAFTGLLLFFTAVFTGLVGSIRYVSDPLEIVKLQFTSNMVSQPYGQHCFLMTGKTGEYLKYGKTTGASIVARWANDLENRGWISSSGTSQFLAKAKSHQEGQFSATSTPSFSNVIEFKVLYDVLENRNSHFVPKVFNVCITDFDKNLIRVEPTANLKEFKVILPSSGLDSQTFQSIARVPFFTAEAVIDGLPTTFFDSGSRATLSQGEVTVFVRLRK